MPRLMASAIWVAMRNQKLSLAGCDASVDEVSVVMKPTYVIVKLTPDNLFVYTT